METTGNIIAVREY